jgi:hypothetical protein
MKPLTLVLAASLAANAALLTLWLAPRPAGAPAAPVPFPPAPAANTAALRTAFQSVDAATLAAAGIPPERIRELQLGHQLAQLAAQRLAQASRSDGPDRWWRNSAGAPSAERQGEVQRRRQAIDALRQSLGDDLGLGTGGDAGPLAFLSPGKREELRRILQDYEEMTAQFGANGIVLPSDRERLRLLAAEKERDLAALLTPAEKLEYELRTSATAATVRTRYGEGLATEDDFRKVYALQKAFDEKFPAEALAGRANPELVQARAAAQRQLQDDLRAALGDKAYDALRRAADSDLRTVDALVGRLGLPTAITDQIAATREALAAESQRISQDAALPMPERRNQLQGLAQRARTELTQALGTEAAEAYAQRSAWLGLLQAGMAYATTPQANALGAGVGSVYPVLPAGVVPGGSTRQVVISSGGEGPGERPIRENVQVMTFSTSTTSSSSPTPPPAEVGAAGTTRRVIITPSPAP